MHKRWLVSIHQYSAQHYLFDYIALEMRMRFWQVDLLVFEVDFSVDYLELY